MNSQIPPGYFRTLEYIRFLKNKIKRLLVRSLPNGSPGPYHVLLQGTGFLAEIAAPAVLGDGGHIAAVWDNGESVPHLWTRETIVKDSDLPNLSSKIDVILITSVHHEVLLRKTAETMFRDIPIIGPSNIFHPTTTEDEAVDLIVDHNCIVFSNLEEVEKHFPGHLARYRFAAHLLEPGKDKVLDIACGCGYGTALLADKAKSCIGADISSGMIQFAEEHWAGKNISYRCIDAEEMENYFRFDSFSFICSLETVEHLQRPLQFLFQLVALLEPGGSLLLSTPQPPHGNPHHAHEFECSELEALFQQLPMELIARFVQTESSVIQEVGHPLPGQQYLLLLKKKKK